MLYASPSHRARSVGIVAVLAGSILMALAAQISIPVPFSPVPITGQTFAIPLLVGLLGTRGATIAIILYLAEGAAGLPVFAPSPTAVPGFMHLVGPTAGYLYGFPVAAAIMGLLFDRGLGRSFAGRIVAIAIGTVAIFTLGAAWLADFVGPQRAFSAGVAPFIVGDGVKIVLAAGLVPFAVKIGSSLLK
ncbi:MAG: biotin transporter BioY [Vulcanimicrobiaceae bacterium]